MREGTTLGVDAKASVATFGHIGKQACRCDTHLLTLAKIQEKPVGDGLRDKLACARCALGMHWASRVYFRQSWWS